ncbi:hypothetical protein J1TS3_36930 [Siminovitchia fordii]|uniref:Uncharacterized protein n=1 Tax=Siminovitchia fordii TaxID=254759 RepID=A0ABQ4KA08_9BACI|nr:hypothetical protein J1TS3_36930 [Siminovitchia fordii]
MLFDCPEAPKDFREDTWGRGKELLWQAKWLEKNKGFIHLEHMEIDLDLG